MKTGRPAKGESAVLAAAGISKKLSMQAQALASLPPEIRNAVAERRMSVSEAVRLHHLARQICINDEWEP